MTGVRVETIQTSLTLSAACEVDRLADRSPTGRPFAALRGSYSPTEPVAHIDAELRRIRVARRSGSKRTAHVHLERLIDYVWGSDSDGGAA
jgi:hypothetical protein